MKLGHYCGGFERKMSLTGFVSLRVLLDFFKIAKTLRMTIDRIYLGKDVYYGCFRCEMERDYRFF